MTANFPKYETAQAAASQGCFACTKPLCADAAKDAGYPAGRGQYVMKCVACGLSTFFDLKGSK